MDCKTPVRPCGYEFSFLFHFHSLVSSFTCLSFSLSPLLLFFPLFSCLIVFHHLSIAPIFFCFSFKLRAFLSLLHSHISAFCLLCLLPQASCVYISVVYFYKCQTVFLAFVYWSREKEMEREAGEWVKGNNNEQSRRREECEREEQESRNQMREGKK